MGKGKRIKEKKVDINFKDKVEQEKKQNTDLKIEIVIDQATLRIKGISPTNVPINILQFYLQETVNVLQIRRSLLEVNTMLQQLSNSEQKEDEPKIITPK